MDDLDAMAHASARAGDVAGLRDALDKGASPYPVMASSNGVATAWCADVVAAGGPSKRLLLLARQAAEADVAEDGDGPKDHLRNLLLRCGKLPRSAWNDHAHLPPGCIDAHEAFIHAAWTVTRTDSDYVDETVTMTDPEYMDGIIAIANANRERVGGFDPEHLRAEHLHGIVARSLPPPHEGIYPDAMEEAMLDQRLRAIVAAGKPSPQEVHTEFVEALRSAYNQIHCDELEYILKGEQSGCSPMTAYTAEMVASLRSIGSKDPIADAMAAEHIGAAVELARHGTKTTDEQVIWWAVHHAEDVDGIGHLSHACPPVPIGMEAVDRHADPKRILDERPDITRARLRRFSAVARDPSMRSDIRLHAWLVIAAAGDEQALDGTVPCPPVRDDHLPAATACIAEISARRPDDAMRLFAALGAASAEPQPVTDPAHLAIEARADAARAEAASAFRAAAAHRAVDAQPSRPIPTPAPAVTSRPSAPIRGMGR